MAKSISRRYEIWENLGGKENIEVSGFGVAQPEGICTRTNELEGLSNWSDGVGWKHLFTPQLNVFFCFVFLMTLGKRELLLFCTASSFSIPD